MSQTIADFELENVGPGPDPFSLSATARDDDIDAIVLLFQRDYHCGNCRKQVSAVAGRYGEFQSLNALVVSVLPEPRDRAASWQEAYDLPYPLLADPSTAVSDEFDQPVRFGILGSLHDLVGRMPVAMVLDTRDDVPTPAYTYEGKMPADRPSIDDLLDAVSDVRGE